MYYCIISLFKMNIPYVHFEYTYVHFEYTYVHFEYTFLDENY